MVAQLGAEERSGPRQLQREYALWASLEMPLKDSPPCLSFILCEYEPSPLRPESVAQTGGRLNPQIALHNEVVFASVHRETNAAARRKAAPTAAPDLSRTLCFGAG